MMTMKTSPAQNIDDYILGCPAGVQPKMQALRETIREAAPEARETINYRMPTFTLEGNLVHFAAFKNHIGFYPAPSAIDQFRQELFSFKLSKGAIRFPLNQPIPFELVSRIVKFRVQENVEKAITRKKKTRAKDKIMRNSEVGEGQCPWNTKS